MTLMMDVVMMIIMMMIMVIMMIIIIMMTMIKMLPESLPLGQELVNGKHCNQRLPTTSVVGEIEMSTTCSLHKTWVFRTPPWGGGGGERGF